MRGASTKLFHAIVGLGVVSGVACGSVVTTEVTGGTTGGGEGGAGGTTTTTGAAGSGGATTTTSSTTTDTGEGGQTVFFDAGPSDAQTWDVVPIK